MPGGGDKSGGGAGGTKPKFADHEKVLCYHGPLLYEAKCVRSRKHTKSGDPGDYQYFVHYQGWNKNWDEWVDETRILKASSENFERKEKLFAQHQANVKEGKKKGSGGASGSKSGSKDGKGPGGGGGGAVGPDGLSFGGSSSSSSKKSDSANTSRASTPVSEPPPMPSSGGGTAQGGSSSAPGSASKQKRSADSAAATTTEGESATPRRSGSSASATKRGRLDTSASSETTTGSTTFNITIPEELKFVLVSDWDLVTSRKSLFSLPAKTPASTILADYVKHVEKNQKALDIKVSTAQEVTLGLKDFFNAVVGDKLLYKIERAQYNEQLASGGEPIDVYGSAHLLRLMAKINGLLNRNRMETEADVAVVSSALRGFLSYLEANRAKFFTSKNYVEAADDYISRAAQEAE